MFGLCNLDMALLCYGCLSTIFGIWALSAKNVLSAISGCKQIFQFFSYEDIRRSVGVHNVHI